MARCHNHCLIDFRLRTHTWQHNGKCGWKLEANDDVVFVLDYKKNKNRCEGINELKRAYKIFCTKWLKLQSELKPSPPSYSNNNNNSNKNNKNGHYNNNDKKSYLNNNNNNSNKNNKNGHYNNNDKKSYLNNNNNNSN
eukprot:167299_1